MSRHALARPLSPNCDNPSHPPANPTPTRKPTLLRRPPASVTELRCRRLSEMEKAERMARNGSAGSSSTLTSNSFGADRRKRARSDKPRDAMGDAKRAMHEADAVFMLSLSGSAPVVLGSGEHSGDEPVKRNRPGQRARRERAIRREEMEGGGSSSAPSHARAPRRGSDASARAPKSTRDPGARAAPKSNASRDRAPHAAAAPAQPEVLHPSWEATRARKVEQSIAEFKGTKVVFGD